MLISGKKIRALRDQKNIYSNSCVIRKIFLNETKRSLTELLLKMALKHYNPNIL
jgi:hypothetical protein